MSSLKILKAIIDQGVVSTVDDRKLRTVARQVGETYVKVKMVTVRNRECLPIIKAQRQQIADLQQLNDGLRLVTASDVERMESISLEDLGKLWQRADEKCRAHCLEVFGTEQPTFAFISEIQ